MNESFVLRRRGICVAACCAAMALCVARPARAEGLLVPLEETGDPRLLPDSVALSMEAQQLLGEGRLVEACIKLAESAQRAHRVTTLLNLAACHEAEPDLAASFSEFREALGLAQAEGRQDLVALAQSRLAKLAPKMSRLTVVLSDGLAARAPELLLDDKPLPAVGVELPVDPGTHVLSAHTEDCQWAVELELDPEERHTESIPESACGRPAAPEPRRPSTNSNPARPAPVEAPPTEKKGWSKREQRELGAVLGAIGTLALFSGLGLELGNDPEHDANPQCGVILPGRGRPTCIGVENRHAKAAVVAGIGAVALTTGFVLWLNAQPPSQNVALRVGIAPGALHAQMTW